MSFTREVLGIIPRLAVMGFFAWIANQAAGPLPAVFLVGLGLGAFLRQAALTWQATRVVPILLQVIDWPKVDRLLEEKLD